MVGYHVRASASPRGRGARTRQYGVDVFVTFGVFEVCNAYCGASKKAAFVDMEE